MTSRGGTIPPGVGAAPALSPYADFGSAVNALSSSLAGEEATGVVSEQDGVLTFTGNGKSGDLQVFSVAEAQLQSAKWDVSFVNVGDATTPILVNVVGTDTAYQGVDTLGDGDNLSAPGGAGFGNWASRILWNHPDATTLDIGGSTQFMGSILAPSAGATITPSTNGRVYEGGDLTVNGAGEEQHAFPWIGHDTTACQSGSLSVRKALTGDAASLVPSDTSFTVSYTVTGGPDKGVAGELSVGADGVPVAGPQLDEGDVVTFSEATPPVVDGVEWGSPSIDPQSLTVTTGTVPVITLTNTATRTVAQVGTFSLRKALSGVDTSAFPTGTVFTVTASWTQDGVAKSQELKLSPDGSVVQGPQDLPVGTVVSFSEAQPVEIDGYMFMGAEFSPEKVTITQGDNPVVIATNTYEDTTTNSGYFTIEKKVEGAEASGREFTFDYAVGFASPVSVTVKAGETWTSPAIPAGQRVTIAETGSTDIDGYDFTGVTFSGEGVTPSEDGKAAFVTIADGSTTAVVATNAYTASPTPTPSGTGTPAPSEMGTPAPSASASAEEGLAETGFDVAPLAIALGALVLGGTLLGVRALRRRRS